MMSMPIITMLVLLLSKGILMHLIVLAVLLIRLVVLVDPPFYFGPDGIVMLLHSLIVLL